MSTCPPPGPGGFGRKIDEAIGRIEMELRQAVTYVNDAVVPQVRRESISAMRSAAEMLRNLADRFEAARPANASANPSANAAANSAAGGREPNPRQADDFREPDFRETDPRD